LINFSEREAEEAKREDMTVLIYCLPTAAKEKDIYKFFQKHEVGKIRDIRIIRDQRSGKSKGVAYVEFFT
jgi:RNA-binding protein 39